MRTIYEPTGRAAEYSPLALNLYNGCAHGCTYCYAPRCLHKTYDDFKANPTPRPGIIPALIDDVKKYRGDTRPILLSFTSDPYQPCESEFKITRAAVGILGDNGLKIRVLTKNGALARRDFDLFKEYDVEFGQTIIFTNDISRHAYEPGASTIGSRLVALVYAHTQGIKTWVSLEPVIDSYAALEVVKRLGYFVDKWKLGKLNHNKAKEDLINWRDYLMDVLRLMPDNKSYYVKDDLWAFADDEIKNKFPKSRE
jgi:DNA repair photolyase